MPDRSERRAALKATHPDLGGDAEEFIAVMRAFDRAPEAVAAPAGGSGAATRGSGAASARPTITTTRRSRTARRARRLHRRLRGLTTGRPFGPRYAHLNEERP